MKRRYADRRTNSDILKKEITIKKVNKDYFTGYISYLHIIKAKNNVKEWYFDVSKYIGIEDGVPYEDDLYLDVVIIPDGRIHVLDEDEIQLAFKNGKITKEEYDLAYEVKDYILEEYGNNINKLIDLTNKLLDEIKRK